jgi:hypothetical protein
VLRAEKAGAAGDVGIADQDVSRHAVSGGAALVGDNRADRRIDDRAAGGPAGVHPVDRRGVLVDHLVMHGAHEHEPVEHLGTAGKMLTDLHAFDCRVDGRVIRSRLFRLRIAERLGSQVSICPAPPPSQMKMQCSALPRGGAAASLAPNAGTKPAEAASAAEAARNSRRLVVEFMRVWQWQATETLIRSIFLSGYSGSQ